jgi:3-mercaptopyruvate sulfurtransferase SseA
MLDFSTYPLVETAWLAEHLSDDDVCIVDARWRGDGTSRELYTSADIFQVLSIWIGIMI